jgi:aromatic-amino-acid transaminase
VLHACCHNPTGADLTAAQWAEVVDLVKQRNLVAFIDMAYQGFADGIKPDAIALDLFAASGLQFVVSSSFSKSFSLYGERVGALTIVTASKDESARVLSQVKRVIRTNYSNPPTHGGAVVAAVLASPELRQQWEDELAGMRDRIRAMRTGLVDKLTAAGATGFEFIKVQRGMFSYTGLTAAQVERLKRRVRHLRRQHRPHLRRRAQHAQHRLRLSLLRGYRDGVGDVRQALDCAVAGRRNRCAGRPEVPRHQSAGPAPYRPPA